MNDANEAMTSMSVGDSLDAELEAKVDKTEIARLEAALAGKEAVGTVEAHNDSASAHPDIRNELKGKLEASDLSCHNTNATAHTDIRGLFSGKEDAGTADNKVAAHNTDAAAHTDIRTRLDSKVDKVSGMGLSSNDFTAAEKADVAMNTGMRHNHNNKALLDSITAAQTDDWCNAAMHMADPVKHITAAERTSWNGRADKTYVDSSLANKANAVDHQLKTYTSLAQIGLSGAVMTSDICAALPNNAMFAAGVTTAIVTDVPDYYSNLVIIRYNPSRISCFCTQAHGNGVWYAVYRPVESVPFSGWKKLANVNESLSLMGITPIPANADIDTYKTLGNYHISTNTNVPTLLHSPFPNRAFRLTVEHALASGNYIMQTARAYNNGVIKSRCYNGNENNTWSEWTPLATSTDLCNPNLLTNPWFGAGVINQRGQGSHIGGMSVDMWRLSTAAHKLTLEADCCKLYAMGNAPLSSALAQRIENVQQYRGKTITASLMAESVSGSDIYIRIDWADSSGANNSTYGNSIAAGTKGVSIATAAIPSSATSMVIVIGFKDKDAVSEAKLYAAKLELGNVSTLTTDPPPNPQQELAKCQRYGFSIDSLVRIRATIVTTNTIDFTLACPTQLRSNPSLPECMVRGITGGTLSDVAFTVLTTAASSLVIRATKANHGMTDAFLHFPSGGFIDANI